MMADGDSDSNIVRIRTIEVVPYNRDWPTRFQHEAEQIAAILGKEAVAIHHIGSTAVPGLAAKPIIDILVEVRDIDRMDDYDPVMVGRGYRPKGEHGIEGRRFYNKGDDIQRTHHLHVFGVGHHRIEDHLHFRDYLSAHPEAAVAYGRLKEDLARRYLHDIDGYVAGKEGSISELIAKAKRWKEGRLGEADN